LDLPQAAALAAERSRIILYTSDVSAWSWPAATVKALGFPEKQWQIRQPVSAEKAEPKPPSQ
ncbi:MAG: hypothetical protein LDL31_13345, partial [Prosthecobacter sp.]|nr:hypothetical protein [Prosthecobacter sp.]